MKELWVWYGLTLMVEVSRKEWAWHKRENRVTKHMSECVVVGDEALALQVVLMRGNMYFSIKVRKQEGESMSMKRGRRAFVEGDVATEVLTERLDIYERMRGDVGRIRKASPNDEYGWERYLRDIESKQLDGSTSESTAGKRRAEISFDSYECSPDYEIELLDIKFGYWLLRNVI
jgi:hypothetical protein